MQPPKQVMRMRPDQSDWRKGRLVVGLIFGLLAAHVNEVSAMIDQQRLHRGVNGPPPLPESARPSPGLQNTIWPPCWRGSGAADNTEILLCSVSSQSSDTHGCLQF